MKQPAASLDRIRFGQLCIDAREALEAVQTLFDDRFGEE
jgi:hypothetical protein